eukprot:TRINITY_DN2033_c0_g1_i1.p1 TRINITY_DN2033_c0_g1~~TRINITY_DN2033_c0_g1_i1.p1  ORF type:complete len:271 (-),score=7.86 TRINITY_DN2033_c0_g1_i1:459-1271(-)
MDEYTKFNSLNVSYEAVDFQRVCSCIQNEDYYWSHTSGIPTMQLPQGLTVLLVEDPRYVNLAVNILKNSVVDNVIAVDLEWRADGLFKDVKYHKISLIQIATFRVCALFRICKLGNALPTSVYQLLTNPTYTVIGCGMQQNDEPRMKFTFGFGVEAFPNYIDMQRIAATMGYSKIGLAGMCRALFKAQMPNKSLSDWEAPRLTINMILYAALDALLASHIIRKLKQMHLQGMACSECGYNFGIRVQPGNASVLSTICNTCYRKTIFQQLP